ncbi:carbamoyltransferase [Candidatus Woesearchaeota archaeon]|nr:carbamoyltransferase [Candidatus Woesearchaeota archaeon]
MRILGINDSHDAGVTLIDNDKVISINEERLNRMKLCYGFPGMSLNEALKIANLKPEDITYVSIATKYAKFVPKPIPHSDMALLLMEDRSKISELSPYLGFLFNKNIWTKIQKRFLDSKRIERQKEITNLLRELGFKCPITFVEHHLCHAASAHFTSGLNKTLIITSDAAGDGLSTTVSIGEKHEIKRLYESNSYNSIAKFYSYVTSILGFSMGKHEGKVTGLAAYGKPIYLNVFKKMIISKNGKIINISNSRHDQSIKKILKKIGDNFSKEDLASSIQLHLENEFSNFVEHWVNKTGIKDVVLAGGLFANVRLNQKIHEIKGINSVYVHPHMGDGGLSMGAALYTKNKFSYYNKKLDTVYFGNEYDDEAIRKALDKNRVNYRYHRSIEKEIARLLAAGKVVARFNGAMEYGPRALGNRSILYQANDPKVNDWLNKKLKRTEFMPFAPVTLSELASKSYLNLNGAEYAAKFMTITFYCNEEMKESCPAVVHLDNTARPQLISEKENPSYYKILREYYKLTNVPTIINTSFNMHEEPIVCSPEDAIRSFKQGHLDYLAIGNFLVEN